MNKKFMAVLLVIVMVVSMVPMTALAADDHVCNTDKIISNGNGKHSTGCSICNTLPDNAWLIPCGDYAAPKDGLCDDCGAAIGHTHAYTIVTPNNNGTHKKACECGEGFNVNCEYVNGVCACGASNVPACQHPADDRSYTDNGNGTHKITCECGDVIAEAAECSFDGGRCVCGAVKRGCQHDMLTYWKDNGNGTHKITCDCGHIVAEAAEHVYEGASCKCGAAKPVVECTHEDTGIVNRGENHEIWCKDCTWNEFKAHTYKNGVCECGAENPCAHGNDMLKYYADNKNGTTHTVTCECGEVLQAAAPHEFNEQDICKCNAVREHECDYKPESNEDGTHNLVCVCGLSENNVACADADKDGKCDDCGYLMPVAPVVPVAPQEPVELPTYAAVSTVGLDNVPKTGNVFVEWLYALIFGGDAEKRYFK